MAINTAYLPVFWSNFDQVTNTDSQNVSAIKKMISVDNDGSIQQKPLTDQEVRKVRSFFKSIQFLPGRLEALELVISSKKVSSSGLAREFYNLLPGDVQNAFKHELWKANGHDDDGLGFQFGQSIVDGGLTNNPLAIKAIKVLASNYVNH